MTWPRLLMIANPGTKRCDAYLEEAQRAGANVEVVPWDVLVPPLGNLDHLPIFDTPAIVRLESPGRSDEVTRLLLAAGARDDPKERPFDWRNLPLPKGALVRPGLWFRGFQKVLAGLHASFQARPHLQPTANPLHCAELFDKTATSIRLEAASIPVPNWLPNPHHVHAALLDDGPAGWRRAYLKLNTGSNAMGMFALRNDRHGLEATTTLTRIDGQFFNTRQLRHLRAGAELAAAIGFVLAEGAIAQEAIALAHVDGQNFDVRVVCLHHVPIACIFRVSPHPMTNLHLGGRRGDYAYCRALIPNRAWLDALDHCSAAAECYDSAMVGIDLLFERGYQRHFILEVNAFGDFFPGWTNAKGETIHQMELTALRTS